VVGAENRPALAGHVDITSDKGRVFFGDLVCRCRELKCGILGRDAKKHCNEGSHRLVAKWPSRRQLVSEGFPNQETSVKDRQKPSALRRSASLGGLRSKILSPVPKDSKALDSLTVLNT
jgi:hypothetical protein